MKAAAATTSKALGVQPESHCHIRCRKSGIMSLLKNLRLHQNSKRSYCRFSNVNLSRSPGVAQAFSAAKIGGKGIQRKFSKLFPKRKRRKRRKPISPSSCSGVQFLTETNELEKVSAWFETMPKQLYLEEEIENMKDDEKETLKCDADDSQSNQSEIVPSEIPTPGQSTVDDGKGYDEGTLENSLTATATELSISGPEQKVENPSELYELSSSTSSNLSQTTKNLEWIHSVIHCWKAKRRSDSVNCKPVGSEKDIHEVEGATRIPEEKPKKGTLEQDNMDEIEHLTSLLNRSSRRKSRMRSIFSLKGQLVNSTSPNSFATRVCTLFNELFSKCYGNRTDASRNQVGPVDTAHQQVSMSADANNNADTHTNQR